MRAIGDINHQAQFATYKWFIFSLKAIGILVLFNLIPDAHSTMVNPIRIPPTIPFHFHYTLVQNMQLTTTIRLGM
jgi:hypothetical protein